MFLFIPASFTLGFPIEVFQELAGICGVRGFNGLEDGQGRPGVHLGQFPFFQFLESLCPIEKRDAFPAPVADFAGNRQTLLVEFKRPAGLAQGRIGIAQVVKRIAFPAPVAGFAGKRQVLLVEFNGPAGLAQGRIGIAQVAQRVAFPAPVAGFAGNRQVLLVEFNGPAGLAQGRIGIAQVVKRLAFPAPVAGFAGNRQVLLVVGVPNTFAGKPPLRGKKDCKRDCIQVKSEENQGRVLIVLITGIPTSRGKPCLSET